MTVNELKSTLPALRGGYLFYGEEEYLKHYYLLQVREAVVSDPALDVFNHVQLDAPQTFDALAQVIAAPPMMAEKKLVELHSIKYAALKKEELDDLCMLMDEAREDGGTVIILYEQASEIEVSNPKKPPSFFKTLCAHATPVEFSHETPGRLVPWITRHFTHEKIHISNEDCLALIEYCTRDMSALSNEITKLCVYLHAHGRDTLSRQDIARVCCRIDEIAAFDFANAILTGDRTRAFTILRDMTAKKQKPQHILGSIAAVYGDLYRIRTLHDTGMDKRAIASALKMNEYKVTLYLRALSARSIDTLRAALDACARADQQLKGTTLPAFGVLCSLVIAG